MALSGALLGANDRQEAAQAAVRRGASLAAAAGPPMDAVALLPVVAAANALGAAFAALTLAILVVAGSYRPRMTLSVTDEVPQLIGRAAAVAVVLAITARTWHEATSLLVWVPVTMALLVGVRAVRYALVRGARRRGHLREPVLIVGGGTVGRRLAERLLDQGDYGVDVVGFLDADDPSLPAPLLGGVGDLDRVVDDYGVRRVIVAFGMTDESVTVDLLRRCEALGLEVHVVPRLFELGLWTPSPDVDCIWDIPLRRVQRPLTRQAAVVSKRAFDVVISGAALIFLIPALTLIAALVRLTSEGPILFRQERIGQWGRRFQLLKFRTMTVNDDSDTTWSVTHDDRVTPLGHFLRKTSLDELPQFLNVLRGHMSLVGPRPERPHFVDEFSGNVRRYHDRHRVPVGITGLAQVNGLRGDSSIHDRAVFDNHYIEHWSLWRDIVILMRTITAVLRPPATVCTGEAEVIDLRTEHVVIDLDCRDLSVAMDCPADVATTAVGVG